MYCLFCIVLCIVCVYMCTVLLPPGGYPIAVKYIIPSFFLLFPLILMLKYFGASCLVLHIWLNQMAEFFFSNFSLVFCSCRFLPFGPPIISNNWHKTYAKHHNCKLYYRPVEMWWYTVTHGRGSEGETGEWSGYPVLFTLPRKMLYPALLPLMHSPRLPVVDWTDAPRRFKWTRPFRRKTKSGFCVCAITFETQPTNRCF